MRNGGEDQDARLGERLLLPLDFAAERSERVGRRLLISMIIFILAALAIMAMAPVREVAISLGQIAPVGNIAEVRHLEGGEVDSFLVSPGDVVAAGQPLIRLRSVEREGRLSQLQARRAALIARAARLRALTEDQDFDAALGAFEGGLDLDDPGTADVLSRERALFEAERQRVAAEEALMTTRQQRFVEQANAHRREREGVREEFAAHNEQVSMQHELIDINIGARRALLEAQALRAQSSARLAEIDGQLVAAIAGAEEEPRRFQQAMAERRAEWRTQQAEIAAELAEIERQIPMLEDQVERLTIRAPMAGVVQDFDSLTPGGVVPPGGLTARVVPAPAELVAEVRISPNDIGHVSVGDTAVVMVTTFDAQRFGEIEGEVAHISPAAFEDEQAGPYFEAQLRLSRLESVIEGETVRLSPGMAVQAEIRTGSKSVLRYLLKPAERALERAFAER